MSRLLVVGEVDLATADDLRDDGIRAVAADGCTELSIDLAGVNFLDSSGIGALVRIRAAAIELGRAVRISAASARVRQVIGVCGLGPVFGLETESSVHGTG